MKIHILIPRGLRKEVAKEYNLSKQAECNNDLHKAWSHLERAHILGQAWPIDHTRTHWRMLLFAFRRKNLKEIIGQFPRLLVGGVKSFVGEIPVGNTGGANVPPLKPMEIPNDLKAIIDLYPR
ncbi:MAG: hypothetical protein A3D31_08230 [Candidatus Fluviicola riflensis]|nr:MAG: hypothetical protein CHH17_06770 [Candidatus Fluviicola riflensis]OGS79927.1 MAG: hypothetical protein A3D31_08230 [Candidatus Fluviicola riflensis]OGS82442.1 MAG: hypothetical protein A2724_17175 [Fluviicola sp. RIFCSPHIGHO2_01_FULL_43_53]OGS88106.1 MAG: hypothetical protein A3E30_14610 [Fluviicola sp. RIFCSPHIGHO2_12_FULL_43_24]